MLTILIAVPLIAGAITACSLSDNGARWLALIATIVDLDLGVYLWANYDPSGPQWQFVERHPISGLFGWTLGIDGIALVLIMLVGVPDADLHRRELARDRRSACPSTWPRSS